MMTRRLVLMVCGALGAWGAIPSAQASPTPQPPGHMLTVTESGTGTGTVSTSDATISCPPMCSHFYVSTAPVTITARPAAGSTFSGWSGACSGSSATCTVSMASNQDVTATFTGTGSPPPAAPDCRLRVPSVHVLLAAPKSQPARRKKVGKLTMSFHCDQTVHATLSITVVERVHHHHVTFRLTRHYTVHPGRARTFTLTLWRGALRGLKLHRHETISFTFMGTNANGSSATGLSALLTGVG